MPNDEQASSTPLIHDDPPRRPYQAYCVTEASSRPCSPDLFIPTPTKTTSKQARPQHAARSSSTLNLTCSSATTRSKDEQHEVDPGQEKNYSQNEEAQANHILPLQVTAEVNEQHITQDVTPRGSHRTTSAQAYTYDQTPSHPRMQHPGHPEVTALDPIKSKSLKEHAAPASIQHPLPPLPTKVNLNRRNDELHFDISVANSLSPTRGYRVEKTSETSSAIRVLSDRVASPISSLQTRKGDHQCLPTGNIYSYRKPLPERKQSAPQATVQIFSSPISSLRKNRGSQRNLLSGNVDVQAQLPSATELYSPRSLRSNTEAAQQACRRTQPKDARLKYQFGRRPSFRIASRFRSQRRDNSSQLGFTQYDSTTHLRSDFSTSTPSLDASVDTQAGPRPPPWGSYDVLEMQRSIRGDARERADARNLRSRADTGFSMHNGSVSAEEESLRREVEEYREQVLRLYPDLKFDGTAGDGVRKDGWCCCVIM